MCRPLHQPDGPLSAGPTASRRTVLRAAGLTGAATAAAGLGLAAATTAVALPRQNTADNVASWRPDPDSPRFTLVVMPDTQYLFGGASIHTEPVEASLRYILDHGRDENIVFPSHLGDLTEHGLAADFGPLSEAFRLLDRRRVGYSVLAGNHDIDSRTDDQRGRTPYLDAFGPQRLRRLPTFGGATPDGYNTYHLFRAAGREWLVLALDWRPSAASFAWARDVIKKHPKTPVILTTHEIVYADQYGDEADFAPHGKRLWDELIADNDQIFLTLNGHYWPPARTTRTYTAGHDVHLHITNYQNRYYGGSAMIRLYRFDLKRPRETRKSRLPPSPSPTVRASSGRPRRSTSPAWLPIGAMSWSGTDGGMWPSSTTGSTPPCTSTAAPVARNPATRTTGLATLGLPWLLGGYEYGGTLDQLMHGWLGDIRIVERALPVRDFMNA